MPAKDPSDQTSKAKTSSHQPPKPLTQDYSNVPQKPIKLKSDVSLPPVLKRSASKSPPTPRKKSSATRSSPARKQPPPPPGPPAIGLSQTALETARRAAENVGVPLDAWLETLILGSAHTATPDSAPELADELGQIRRTLEEIDRRLQRIEQQKGFWQRFWQQYVEPHKR